MACYEYLCPDHGVIEVDAPMGTAPDKVPCTECGHRAGRVYRAPTLAAPSNVVGLLDSCAETSDRPRVVDSLPPKPGGRRTSAPLDPRLQRLPRP